MENKFDYTISEEKEDEPVGYIIDLYSNEKIDYFSEKELLKEYKDIVYNKGINAVRVKVNSKSNNQRHGLKYEIAKEQIGEYGLDYSKEEYERAYKKRMLDKKHER